MNSGVPSFSSRFKKRNKNSYTKSVNIRNNNKRQNTFKVNSFNKKGKQDWFLIFLLFILMIFGLTFLSSALSSANLFNYTSEFYKQVIFSVWIGGVMCWFLARYDYHKLVSWGKTFYILTLIPLIYLAIFIAIGRVFNITNFEIISALGPFPIKPIEVNGALRWISISFLPNIQPAEIAKLFLLIYTAYFVKQKTDENLLNSGSRYNKAKNIEPLKFRDIGGQIGLIGFSFLLILIQPDLGSVLIAAFIIFTALWFGKVNNKLLIQSTIVVFIVSVISILALAYRSQRVRTFVDFYTDPIAACSGEKGSGQNFQVCQIRKSLIEGGMFGKGFGESNAKNTIPEVTTDAILSVIGEEAGFIGIFCLLLIYFLIFIRGMRIATKSDDISGSMLSAGISVWILSQAIVNIAGVTGLIPLKGTPLPFVSEGGSAIVLNLMSMGILFNIASQRKSSKIKS